MPWFEEVAVLLIFGILVGGGWLIHKSLKRPQPTNANYELAVEAYERATQELAIATRALEVERAVLTKLSAEMTSSLMLASGQGTCLTPEREHELHVGVELDRRRGEERKLQPGQTITH